MIRRKLIVINTAIIILAIVTLVLASIQNMRRLFYHESSIIFEAQIDRSYDRILAIFSEAERLALNVCINERLTTYLDENRTSRQWSALYSQLMTSEINRSYGENAYYTVSVHPANQYGEIFSYDRDLDRYRKTSLTPGDFEVERGYLWVDPDDANGIRVIRKMYDKDKATEVVAIVMVDINMPTIAEIFWDFSVQSQMNDSIYLLDAAEQVVYPYYIPKTLEMSEVRLEAQDFISYEMRNERITIVRRFPQNQWALVDIIEAASLLTGSRSIINQVLLFGGLLILATITLTYVATKLITDPILKLARQMQREGLEKEYREIEVGRSTGEIKVLYQSFNDMIGTTKRYMQEIRLAAQREKESEFLLLQAQINPHFLYNTMDAIGWMAMQHNATEIQDLVVYLVGMFRNSINRTGRLITLQSEIEQVRYYLNIMQVRYPNTYTVEYRVDEWVENYMVIRQILQPLVENALQHGIYESGVPGHIVVEAFEADSHLFLQVRNNGTPVDLERVGDLLDGNVQAQSDHYGIRNVNERLKTFYGEGHGLQFYIMGGETVASIKLPLERITEGSEDDVDA